MLKPDIEAQLNKQINCEQAAGQEYLAMAAYFEGQTLRGFAKFMRRQAEEERAHALRLFDHVFDRGGTVRLGAIAEPAAGFGSTRAVFDAALAREKANTASIHELYAMASETRDYATQTMLHWFIDEQVEEEQWATEALDLLDMVGDNRSALLMLDKRYGEKAEAGV